MGPAKIPTYLEIGTKRAFAGSLDWPGWCRAGKDEATALEALRDSARRYAKVLRGTRIGFETLKDASALRSWSCSLVRRSRYERYAKYVNRSGVVSRSR